VTNDVSVNMSRIHRTTYTLLTKVYISLEIPCKVPPVQKIAT